MGAPPVGREALLKARGIRCSSPWRDDIPYRHARHSGAGSVEFPVNGRCDDWLHGLTCRASPRPLFPRDHVPSIWKDEFDQTGEWGGVTTMVMHPQVTGRPMRIRFLDDVLGHARGFGVSDSARYGVSVPLASA